MKVIPKSLIAGISIISPPSVEIKVGVQIFHWFSGTSTNPLKISLSVVSFPGFSGWISSSSALPSSKATSSGISSSSLKN